MNEAEQKLWAYVLLQAVNDLKGRNWAARSARAWFSSKADTIGSFNWICHHLALEPNAVRGRVLKVKAGELSDCVALLVAGSTRAA